VLPGIISDRMFTVFDADRDGFLSLQDFYDGMMTLFTKPFEELSLFIFQMYDADSDGKISRDDIKSLMQYIHIDNEMMKNVNTISSNLKFSDRVESQKEIFEKLEDVYGKEKYLDYKKFKTVVEEKNSDIYIFLLIFLLENRPFKKQTIEYYLGCLKTVSKSSNQTQSKLIASPTLHSKFSPANFISNSPVMKQKKLAEKKGANLLDKYTSKGEAKKSDVLNKLSGGDKNNSNLGGPVRKNMAFLKNLEGNDLKPKSEKNKHDENDPKYNLGEARKYEDSGNLNKKIGISDKNIVKDDDEDEVIQYAGWISKITETQKLKRLWFKLYDKDLFCKIFLNLIL
jgi:Ca2+-binding EF-hand superfamily protein